MMICRWQFIVAIPDSLLFSRQWPRRSRHLLTNVFEETIGDLTHRHLRCAGDVDFRRTFLANSILSCGTFGRAGRTQGNMSSKESSFELVWSNDI